MDIVDPRARWPDGTLVENPFRPGSFRWSLIAEWWFWEDDTREVIAEIMGITVQGVSDARKEIKAKTGWGPPIKRKDLGEL